MNSCGPTTTDDAHKRPLDFFVVSVFFVVILFTTEIAKSTERLETE